MYVAEYVVWQNVVVLWEYVAVLWQNVAVLWEYVAVLWQNVVVLWLNVAVLWPLGTTVQRPIILLYTVTLMLTIKLISSYSSIALK
jgi:hypothetical protein